MIRALLPVFVWLGPMGNWRKARLQPALVGDLLNEHAQRPHPQVLAIAARPVYHQMLQRLAVLRHTQHLV